MKMKKYNFKNFFNKEVQGSQVTLKHNNTHITNAHFLINKSILRKSHLSFIEKSPQDDLSQFNSLLAQIADINNLTEFIPTHFAEWNNKQDKPAFIMENNDLKIAMSEQYYYFFKSLDCKVFATDSMVSPMAIYNRQNEFVGLVLPVRINTKKEEQMKIISITEYEQALQEEQAKQKENQGKYKRLPVVAYSGIKQKLAYKYKTINDIEFWSLKEDENKDNWRNALYLHNDHLFYINSFQQLENYLTSPENKERYNNYFSDFQKTITEEFELSLEKAIAGEYNRINTGYANFLNRYNEAKEAADHYNKIKDEAERIKAEEQAKKEAEQRKKELQELKEAEKQFLKGEYISSDMFLSLCDMYNIKLPLRTRGWIINSLVKIKSDSYSANGNKSTVIFKYVEQLEEVLKAA